MILINLFQKFKFSLICSLIMSSRIQRTRGQTPAEIVKRLDNALSTLQRGRDDTEMEKV